MSFHGIFYNKVYVDKGKEIIVLKNKKCSFFSSLLHFSLPLTL